MKKDFIVPVLILSLICLFVSGALAVVNSFTDPIIKNNENERAQAARKEIIPQAEDFIKLEIDNLPNSIIEAYKTSNNAGYIFTVTTHGYGGEIKLICGVDPKGFIIRTAVLSHNETQGLGTPIFEEPYSGLFWNKDKNAIESIDVISGATITSNAYKNSIRDSLLAYDILIAEYYKEMSDFLLDWVNNGHILEVLE